MYTLLFTDDGRPAQQQRPSKPSAQTGAGILSRKYGTCILLGPDCRERWKDGKRVPDEE